MLKRAIHPDDQRCLCCIVQATLGEQATQLDVLESTKAEVAQQQEQIAMQGKQLQEAEERCSQLRQTLVESSAAKDQADKVGGR